MRPTALLLPPFRCRLPASMHHLYLDALVAMAVPTKENLREMRTRVHLSGTSNRNGQDPEARGMTRAALPRMNHEWDPSPQRGMERPFPPRTSTPAVWMHGHGSSHSGYDLDDHHTTSAPLTWSPADEPVLHPLFEGRYVLRQLHHHGDATSTASSTTSNATGPPTPEPPVWEVERLGDEVCRHVATLDMLGDHLIAQMLAQELHRWAGFSLPGIHGRCLTYLAGLVQEYRVPGMEIGVVLGPLEGRWLSHILACASRAVDPQGVAADSTTTTTLETAFEHEDVVSFMGGRAAKGQGRSPSPSQGRHRGGRPRSRSTRRERRGDDRDQERGDDRDDRERDDAGAWRGPHPWSLASRSMGSASAHRDSSSHNRPRQRNPPREDRTETTSTRCLAPGTPTTPSMSERQRALSFNRLTWRNLLGIEDEGPGLDLDRFVPRPLDETQAENVAATVQTLDDSQRVAFMGAFIRYILEVTHQTTQIIITGDPGDPNRPFHHDDFDDTMMTQTYTRPPSSQYKPRDTQCLRPLPPMVPQHHSTDTPARAESDEVYFVQTTAKLLHEAREMFNALQRELERGEGRRTFRAGWILRHLEARYLGVLPHEYWCTTVQEVHAMLVVISDGNQGMPEDQHDSADEQFALEWWRKLRRFLLLIDKRNSLLQGTHLVAADQEPEPIDLDTPPPPSQPDSVDTAMEKQIEDHLKQRDAEEQYVVALYEQHQESAEAARYQSWEDWAMRDEMENPPGKRPRCHVQVTTHNGASSSSATLTLPPMQAGEPMSVTLTIVPVLQDPSTTATSTTTTTWTTQLDETCEGQDHDQVAMMQRMVPNHVEDFVRTLDPHTRRQVVDRLRWQLEDTLRTVRRQLRVLEEHCTVSSTSSLPARRLPHSIIDALARLLQTLMDEEQVSSLAGNHEVAPAAPEGAAEPMATDESTTPRRRTATSSTIRGDVDILAGPQLHTTCDMVENIIDTFLMNEVEVDERYGVLREFIMRLLQRVHEQAGQHRVLLQVIARRLPLPTLLESTEEACSLRAEDLVRRLLDALHHMTGTIQELSLQVPMDQEWAVSQLPLFSPLALDIMAFLECGAYDDDLDKGEDEETQSMQSEAEYRPGFDKMRNQPDFHEDMLRKRRGMLLEGDTQVDERLDTSRRHSMTGDKGYKGFNAPGQPRSNTAVDDDQLHEREEYDDRDQGTSMRPWMSYDGVEGKGKVSDTSNKGSTGRTRKAAISKRQGSEKKKVSRKGRVVTEGLRKDPDGSRRDPPEPDAPRHRQRGLVDFLK